MGDPKPLASLSSSLLARKGAARPAMRRQINFSAAPADTSGHEDLGWNDMGYDVNPPQSPTPISDKADGDDERKANPLAGAIPEVVKQQDALKQKLQPDSEAVEPDPDHDEQQEKSAPTPVSDVPDQASAETEKPRGIGSILSRKPGASQPVMPESKAASQTVPVEQPAEKPSEPAVVQQKKPAAPARPKRVAKAARGDAAGKRAAFTLRLDPQRHLRLRLACAVHNQSAQQLVTQALDEMLGSLPEIDALAGQLPATAKKA